VGAKYHLGNHTYRWFRGHHGFRESEAKPNKGRSLRENTRAMGSFEFVNSRTREQQKLKVSCRKSRGESVRLNSALAAGGEKKSLSLFFPHKNLSECRGGGRSTDPSVARFIKGTKVPKQKSVRMASHLRR